MKKVDESLFPSLKQAVPAQTLSWADDGSSLLCKTPIFNLESVTRTSNDGRTDDFVRLQSPDWVSVIPYFKGSDGIDYFVMERQFRHGSGTVTVEFPGGIVERGEEPMKSALRELEEETGIKAGKLSFLGSLNPNSAFINSTGYFYMAEELEYSGCRHFDPNEQIETVCVPVSVFFEKMGSGEFNNGVMAMAGFFFLKLSGKRCRSDSNR